MQNQPREPQPYEDRQTKSIQEFGWTSQGMDSIDHPESPINVSIFSLNNWFKNYDSLVMCSTLSCTYIFVCTEKNITKTHAIDIHTLADGILEVCDPLPTLDHTSGDVAAASDDVWWRNSNQVVSHFIEGCFSPLALTTRFRGTMARAKTKGLKKPWSKPSRRVWLQTDLHLHAQTLALPRVMSLAVFLIFYFISQVVKII